uniref:DNA-directed RNA polymerase n=1 Tax=Ulva torta TaxID=932731 RepID=A0A7R6NFM9_9CHLO|nr:hypothetical protein JXY92_mgp26 [Ulva torta]AZP40269.1 hypothetical protein [Ulva torta]
MGVINNDKQLCELTNVLLSDDKRDMYSFFLERIKANCDSYAIKDKRKSLEKLYNNYFQTNIDRKLIKAIVMPLIYGKTGQGFAINLKEFFAKENLYPKEIALIILASQIIKTLKNDPVFANVNLFMKALRAIGAFMFEFDDFSIKGYYNDSHIVYYKEEVEEIRIYYKQKGKKYKSQKIYLSKPARDISGCLIKSKTKSINAFVANYIHFIDASICHYVVDNFNNKRTFKMGTIHDCFFIKPTEIPMLRDAYSNGLRWVYQIHIYNLLNWCYKICEYYNNKSHLKCFEQELQEIKVFLDDSEQFINNRKTEVNISCLTNIKNVLLNIIPSASVAEKQRILTIIDYIDKIYLVNSPLLIDTDFGQLLFSDNS